MKECEGQPPLTMSWSTDNNTLSCNKILILHDVCDECYSTVCTDTNHMNISSQPTYSEAECIDSLHSDKTALGESHTDSTQQDTPQQISNDSHSCFDFNFRYRGIHMTTPNSKHLKPKLDEVKLLLSSENQVDLDIFGICETFFNTSIDDIKIVCYWMLCYGKKRQRYM